ncbi:hypothetical protein [Glycomyces salinus]|uniref:hypothetical protein n=1 Tax=Glycomyces salinus TaxID=980294 RepID=UPI0018ECF3A1|nr:hypothetical protein [Glycomyces salinus]
MVNSEGEAFMFRSSAISVASDIALQLETRVLDLPINGSRENMPKRIAKQPRDNRREPKRPRRSKWAKDAEHLIRDGKNKSDVELEIEVLWQQGHWRNVK